MASSHRHWSHDPLRHYNDHSNDAKYFMNFYLAATKHIDLKGHELGVHLAYRYYPSEYNKKWQGVVGGITYRPSFAKNLRGIVEYTGNDVNIGVDYYLWKLLFLQASLQKWKILFGRHHAASATGRFEIITDMIPI